MHALSCFCFLFFVSSHRGFGNIWQRKRPLWYEIFMPWSLHAVFTFVFILAVHALFGGNAFSHNAWKLMNGHCNCYCHKMPMWAFFCILRVSEMQKISFFIRIYEWFQQFEAITGITSRWTLDNSSTIRVSVASVGVAFTNGGMLVQPFCSNHTDVNNAVIRIAANLPGPMIAPVRQAFPAV